MAQPLVSIVIPAFNGLPYIEQAYRSCLDQTYPNIEICVSDGGSTDGTIEWIRGLPDSVRTDFLPSGTSAAENWTHATQMASGEFIKLLCQDDLLYPQAIEHQVADLLENPEAAMALAQRDVISASGKVLYRNRGLNGLSAGVHSGQDILESVYLGGTNMLGEPHVILFRREPALAGMPWHSRRHYSLDLDTYTGVLEREDATAIVRKESIGAFRVSTSSWSTRLVSSQLEQLGAWQHEYEARSHPGTLTRMRARTALYKQHVLRMLAYSWLSFKRDMG